MIVTTDIKQTTISKKISLKGVGLHTGKDVTLTFVPSFADSGYVFKRVDLENSPTIQADIKYVSSTDRGTCLNKNGLIIQTCEHVLAALVGSEIDNVIIELNESEPPIMDGSAKFFVDALEKAGVKQLHAKRREYIVKKVISFKDEDTGSEIMVLPAKNYKVTTMVDFGTKILGTQNATIDSISEFIPQISNCRTFSFLHEIEMLLSKGLIKGGDLNNAIVIVDKVISKKKLDKISNLMGRESVEVKEEGILNNTKLQYKNEPARHKLLDIVGDLALVGRPIKGHVIAARPGHKSNVEFAKILKKSIKNGNLDAPKYDSSQKPVYGINEIKKILHHRYPFLFVDKITYLDESQVVGIKNVTTNEPFFNGHFPENPIMPGVLQVEALAQVGGILVMNFINDPENHIPYLAGIEKFRFRKMVIPGDTLIMRCKLLAPIKRGIAKMRVEAFVDNYLVGEGNMTATITKKNNE